MRRGLLRWFRKGDSATGPEDARRVTRRRLLAATVAAGVGLGFVGTRGSDGDAPGNRPPGERIGTERHGGRRPTDSRDTPIGGEAATERAHDSGDTTRGVSADAPIVGANLNGRPRLVKNNLELIDASHTTWVRAFLDVRNKIADGRPPEDDPDVAALRQVASERNCKLLVSLKWDFTANWRDKEPTRVPKPGSKYERALCRGAARCLESIGAAVDVVVLGNEPMWETREADIDVEDPPIVGFTRTVKDYLVDHGDHGDSTYLVGAFNRAHDDNVRERQFRHFYRDMFDFVREDDDVAGIDIHLHYDAIAEVERAVAVAREAFPDETITATEFSPVWRYNRYKDTPIDEFEAGEQFARDHGLPGRMTAVEYFEYAKRHPRPPEEVATLYDALPWYNVNHVADVYDVFADYGVSVGTLGFVQSPGMREEDWTRHWAPFHINFLFQPALIRTDDGIEATANRHYLEDYRERAGRVEST